MAGLPGVTLIVVRTGVAEVTTVGLALQAEAIVGLDAPMKKLPAEEKPIPVNVATPAVAAWLVVPVRVPAGAAVVQVASVKAESVTLSVAEGTVFPFPSC